MMQWPPSNPTLAREASALLTQIEFAIKGNPALDTFKIPFDFLGRLFAIALPVVPEEANEFPGLAKKFAQKLPSDSYTRLFLERYFVRNYRDDPLSTKEANEIYRLFATAKWYSVGCPAVTLERNLAASLMVTETADELVDAVMPPWDCFMVRLPADLIEEARLEFTHLLVHRHIRTFKPVNGAVVEPHPMVDYLENLNGVTWGLYGLTSGDDYFPKVHKLGVLLGKERGEYFDIESETIEPVGENRLFQTLARLVVGICHLAETPNTLRRKSTKKKQHMRWRLSKLPLTTEYVLAADVPVKLDCTEAIGAYIRGDRKALPRFQYLVRGHWRNQAHGPGRTARKRIWIQPYWKGPEDMPRLFREHRFEGPEAGSSAPASGGR